MNVTFLDVIVDYRLDRIDTDLERLHSGRLLFDELGVMVWVFLRFLMIQRPHYESWSESQHGTSGRTRAP
jgi:hypothetical protein